MPITHSVLTTADADPHRLAIVGAAAHERLDYAGLVACSRTLHAAVAAAHRAQAAPPAPVAEAGGIPLTAISLTDAFETSWLAAGLMLHRDLVAVLDPRWPLAHRVDIVRRAGVGIVVSDSPDLGPALARTGWGGTVLTPGEVRARQAAAPPAPAPVARDGDEPFLLLFSSGTTRAPKGFVKTRAQYRANFAVSRAHLEPEPGVHTLAPGPVSYSLTLWALIECLASGGTAHVADGFDARALARRIHDERITRLVAVPAVVQALTDAARRDPERFAALELVVTGGANLPRAIRDGLAEVLPRVRLISYYGAAEIGFIGDSRGGDGTLLDVYDGVRAQIRDADGRVLGDGEPGELWICADSCSDGYVTATTPERLRDADGWATVHDHGTLTGGRLRLAGRAGDIAVTGGHKVSLQQVEHAFDGMGLVGAACAIALPHPRLGSVIALVVDRSPAPTAATLRDFARAHLAPQYVPHRWYRVDQLPRTVGGKIRRGETTALVEAGEAVRL